MHAFGKVAMFESLVGFSKHIQLRSFWLPAHCVFFTSHTFLTLLHTPSHTLTLAHPTTNQQDTDLLVAAGANELPIAQAWEQQHQVRGYMHGWVDMGSVRQRAAALP